MIPPARRALALALSALALAAAPAAAQEVYTSPTAPDTVNGCRGFGYGGNFDMTFNVWEHLPVIRDIYPGTPGALAGLQAGDSLVTVNGSDMLYPPRRGLWRQPPGTRYHVRVKRGAQVLDLVMVYGRARPDAVGPERHRTCAPIPGEGTPPREVSAPPPSPTTS